MQDLIFVSHRIPYPPNKGEKTRTWNFLCRVARDYRVHHVSFVDDPADFAHEQVLQDLCTSCLLVPLDRKKAKIRSARGLLTGTSLTVPYFQDGRVARWIEETRRRVDPPLLYASCSGIAHYAMGPQWQGVRRVIDFMDIDSDKWVQYARRKKGLWRWVFAREGRKLLDFERAAARAYDATLFVSETEAAMFRDLCPDRRDQIHVLRQGVDVDFFDPASAGASPYPADAAPVIFTGTMNYWPNVDAVTWFAREVLPDVRRRHPAACFYIVGAHPAQDVLDLGELDGVHVTGRVEDIRPWMAHARGIVAPLRIARGIQTKVLEAMAMGRPTVVSSLALEGIEAEPGRDLLVADEPGACADAVVDVLENGREEIGQAARTLVTETYSWDASYAHLRTLL